jgi:HemX protein
VAELLVWPALLGYGEAAVALVGEARRPGLAGRLAIWGVRVGWLAHTALLVAQFARSDGFPWSSFGGALNLFAWLVVGAYLVWGCRPRFRLVGLALMPVAAVLLTVAYATDGVGTAASHPDLLLAAHVALMLGAFAAFTVSAALAVTFLWQERRLKRHARTVLRVPVPPLASLETLAARTVLAGLAALALGVVAGLASLALDGGRVDMAMAVTLVPSGLYGALLVAHRREWLAGRRFALAASGGFASVALILSLAHFA